MSRSSSATDIAARASGAFTIERAWRRSYGTRMIAVAGRPRPDTRSADVLVLGAGLAGTMAAAELHARGLSVLLIEGRARVGGRVCSIVEPRVPLPIELGAEFVHGDAKETIEVVRDAGLALVEMSRSHWTRERGLLGEAPRYEGSLESAFERTKRLVRAHGDRSFARAIEEVGVREPMRKRVLAYVEGFQAADAGRISALSLAKPDLGSEEVRRVLGGYASVAERLAERLPRDAVRLSTTITRVRWREGRVEVDCKAPDGAPLPPFRARRAVVALPLLALRGAEHVASVAFDPPLAAKARPLARLEMGNVVKATFLFREPFWRERSIVRAKRKAELDKLAFLHAEDQPFPTWWTGHPMHAPMLTAWAGGGAADALEGLDAPALVRRAVASLSEALGVDEAAIERALVAWWTHDWRSDPFAGGAYSYPLVGGTNAPAALAKPVARTLFFAGEATCVPPANGTVHGALASGRRAAKELLASFARPRAAARRRPARRR